MFVFKTKGAKFYRGRYRLSDSPKWYDVPLRVEQKEIAEAKLRQIVRDREEEMAGLVGPKALREAAQRSLALHLVDFVADLTARKRGRAHLVHVKCRLERLLEECRWRIVADVTAESFTLWRAKQAKLSAKTLNEYFGHATALLNWLVRQGRASGNPLKAVHKLDRKDTFRRRALTPVELWSLAERSGKRAFPYLFAGCTGLRRGEMKQLLWADIRLEVPQPFIELRAEITKSKRADIVPLLPILVEALRREKAKGVHVTGRVFPRGLPSAKTLAKDLVACGIPVEDARGYRVDFHALRHTFASLLATANVSELARMKLARHTEWKMTDRYTDSKSIPLFAEMDKLAAILPSQLASQISGKTGQNLSNPVHFVSPILSAETVVTDQKKTALAIADQSCLLTENGAQGGTRTPKDANAGNCGEATSRSGLVAPSQLASQTTDHSGPELDEIARSWAALPDAIRTTILMIVRAAKGSDARRSIE